MIKLILILLLSNFIFLSAQQNSITVSMNGKIKSISDAISLASNGSEILIEGGIYKEGNILIDKQLKIRGINNPVLDGENKYEVLTIKADNVVIEGLTIKNAGVNFLYENAGIRLDEVKGGVIRNNTFIENYFGIYLAKSENCLIENNYFKSNAISESSSGNGIHLWYSKNIDIKNNEISGHRDGIYLEFVRHGLITGNRSHNNLRYGLHFMFSDTSTYSNNLFEHNGAGVAVMYTKNVLMEDNLFQHNWGPASYGLLLKDINNSIIRNNVFYKNTSAIYLEGCSRNTVINNKLQNNGWAIKLMANSMDNFFSANDFISNTFEVSTNSRQNFNTFEGNYWSEYRGYDLDKDGIGDVPYRPVKLYSLLVEKQPASVSLMRSMFISLIDIAESIIPSITPAALMDEKPMMRRIN